MVPGATAATDPLCQMGPDRVLYLAVCLNAIEHKSYVVGLLLNPLILFKVIDFFIVPCFPGQC